MRKIASKPFLFFLAAAWIAFVVFVWFQDDLPPQRQLLGYALAIFLAIISLWVFLQISKQFRLPVTLFAGSVLLPSTLKLLDATHLRYPGFLDWGTVAFVIAGAVAIQYERWKYSRSAKLRPDNEHTDSPELD